MDIELLIRLLIVALGGIIIFTLLIANDGIVFKTFWSKFLVFFGVTILFSYATITEIRKASIVDQKEELERIYLDSAKKALNAKNINFFKSYDDLFFFYKIYADDVIYDIFYSKDEYLYISKDNGSIKIFPDKKKIRVLKGSGGSYYWEYPFETKTKTISISSEPQRELDEY